MVMLQCAECGNTWYVKGGVPLEGVSGVRCPACKSNMWRTFGDPPVALKEEDPHGIGQHEPGAKLDRGKATFSMTLGYFSNALAEVDRVSLYGAKKYSHWGWLSVLDGIARYTEADLRHILSELAGEQKDADTKLLHAAHHAWNALARLELILRDRSKKRDD